MKSSGYHLVFGLHSFSTGCGRPERADSGVWESYSHDLNGVLESLNQEEQQEGIWEIYNTDFIWRPFAFDLNWNDLVPQPNPIFIPSQDLEGLEKSLIAPWLSYLFRLHDQLFFRPSVHNYNELNSKEVFFFFLIYGCHHLVPRI